MKRKFLILVNTCLALILVALGFQSCNREKTNVDNVQKPDTTIRKGGEIRLMYGVRPTPFREVKAEEPKNE